MDIDTLHRITEYLIDHRKLLLEDGEDIEEINTILDILQEEIENES